MSPSAKACRRVRTSPARPSGSGCAGSPELVAAIVPPSAQQSARGDGGKAPQSTKESTSRGEVRDAPALAKPSASDEGSASPAARAASTGSCALPRALQRARPGKGKWALGQFSACRSGHSSPASTSAARTAWTEPPVVSPIAFLRVPPPTHLQGLRRRGQRLAVLAGVGGRGRGEAHRDRGQAREGSLAGQRHGGRGRPRHGAAAAEADVGLAVDPDHRRHGAEPQRRQQARRRVRRARLSRCSVSCVEHPRAAQDRGTGSTGSTRAAGRRRPRARTAQLSLTIAWAGVPPRASHVRSASRPRTNRTSPPVAVADPPASAQLRAYWRPTTAAPGSPVARRTAPCAAASPAAPAPATSTAGPGARCGPAGRRAIALGGFVAASSRVAARHGQPFSQSQCSTSTWPVTTAAKAPGWAPGGGRGSARLIWRSWPEEPGGISGSQVRSQIAKKAGGGSHQTSAL